MKIVINWLIYTITKIWSVIFSYDFISWLNKQDTRFYSFWIYHFIPNCSRNVWINRGLDLRGAEFINIGPYTRIGKRCILNCWNTLKTSPSLSIGEKCGFGDYTHITCANKIVIGDNCLTGRFCLITDNSHGQFSSNELHKPPRERQIFSKGEIIIGNNVWLGDRVTICADVIIGDGAIIAANSVVTHDIPSYCIAAGSPARIVKKL